MDESDIYFDFTEKSLESLFLTLHPRLRLYALRLTGHGSVAEDMLQEVFLKFIQRKPHLSPDAVPGYIFAMLRNECVSHLRREKVVGNRVSLNDDPVRIMVETLLHKDFTDSDTGFTSAGNAALDDVLNFANLLPDRTREVFTMSRIENLSNKDIASLFGISVKAVEKHISLSIKRFRKEFRNS